MTMTSIQRLWANVACVGLKIGFVMGQLRTANNRHKRALAALQRIKTAGAPASAAKAPAAGVKAKPAPALA